MAMVIATYEYEDPRLRQLTAPAHDAEALAAVLRDPAIAGFDVTTLINQPHYQIGEALGNFFRDRRSDDLTLVYFSGHGLKDDNGELYFTMTNTRKDSLLFTSLAADHVHRAMESCPSRRQVLVLDCCYSGAFPVGRIAKADDSVHTLERFQGRGRTVLTASDSTQYSFEGDNVQGVAGQSVFTRHLVAGLRDGSADLNNDGDIDLDELYDYVHDKVVEERSRQRPKKQANVEGRLVIARNVHWSLPVYIRNALDSPLPEHRLHTLKDLDRLYRNGNPVVRAVARQEIQRLTEDDSRRVSAAAAALLEPAGPRPAPVQSPSPDEQRARREAKEQAKREAEERAKREAEERARREAAIDEFSRDEIRALIRQNGREDFYRCPDCGAPTKGHNLLHHLDREHGAGEFIRGPFVLADDDVEQAQRKGQQRAQQRVQQRAEELARQQAQEQARREAVRQARREELRQAQQRPLAGALSREEVKDFVRRNGADSCYRCPHCGATMKGKSLVRHLDTEHPGRL